jgi:hypothetical protein
MAHYSDCAVHNESALPRGDYDCGGLELAEDSRHGAIVLAVASAGSGFGDIGSAGFVQSPQLPVDRLIADTAAPGLPNSHDGLPFLGKANCMDFDRT